MYTCWCWCSKIFIYIFISFTFNIFNLQIIKTFLSYNVWLLFSDFKSLFTLVSFTLSVPSNLTQIVVGKKKIKK